MDDHVAEVSSTHCTPFNIREVIMAIEVMPVHKVYNRACGLHKGALNSSSFPRGREFLRVVETAHRIGRQKDRSKGKLISFRLPD